MKMKAIVLLPFSQCIQSDNDSNRVYFLGHKFGLTPSQSSDISLSRAQNIFMPANINSIVLIVSVCITFKRCYALTYRQFT